MGDRVFFKMSYHPCVSGCDRYLALRTVTIAASRGWAFSTQRKLSWMVHVLLVETWPSWSCIIDSAMSNMAGSLCLCRDLVFFPAPGAMLHPDKKKKGRDVLRIMVRAFPSGVPLPSSTPQPAGVPMDQAGTSAEWGTPPISFGAPPDDRMSIAASEGELSNSGDGDLTALPPSGVVVLSEPDQRWRLCFPGLPRMSGSCGILHRVPILRGWTSGFSVEVAPPSGAILSWKAPFTAQNKYWSSSPFTTLDGGAALWYTGIPSVSSLVVQECHLCLCLTDMEQEKVQFLNAPMSQTGLFGDVVESFVQ